jgi:hypothetical protein
MPYFSKINFIIMFHPWLYPVSGFSLCCVLKKLCMHFHFPLSAASLLAVHAWCNHCNKFRRRIQLVWSLTVQILGLGCLPFKHGFISASFCVVLVMGQSFIPGFVPNAWHSHHFRIDSVRGLIQDSRKKKENTNYDIAYHVILYSSQLKTLTAMFHRNWSS